MKSESTVNPVEVVEANRRRILDQWLADQRATGAARPDILSDGELEEQSSEVLDAFLDGLRSGAEDIAAPSWDGVRSTLRGMSIARARLGFSPAETALFVFSLKRPVFSAFGHGDADAATILQLNTILDRLGLYTIEVFQQGREEIIMRQQQEMLELSTPVVKLWEGVLALPLIGTLDSERTQVVMETLLQSLINSGSSIAIIDITGVPTVDTKVAQHLIQTVSAARLMGADCIISGIRPQIAQTIIHLGVTLPDVVTKATLADAFSVALARLGQQVTARETKTADQR